jgi:RNA polymerase sigma-70 factor (ECF subfamily)
MCCTLLATELDDAHGAADQLAELYAAYRPQVLTLLRRTMQDAREAEDVLHEVFLKAFRALSAEPETALGLGWLLTVARTTAIDAHRRQARTSPSPPAAIVELSDARLVHAAHRAPWLSDPEVQRMVERLPRRQQEILVLRYVLDCSHLHAARILGCSEQAVRKGHQRALHALASALADSELGSRHSGPRLAMQEVRLPRRLASSGFSLLVRITPRLRAATFV